MSSRLLLAAAIACAYANSLGIGFHFDDWHVLEQNPHIRSLGEIPRYFVDPDTTSVLHENKDLRPVLMTTFALNYAVSGTAPWSYHVVTLLLHWIVALLVLRIVRDHLWLGDDGPVVGLAAALVVALHPLNTEPVDYVSARSAVLTTAFCLGAFDAAVRRRASVAVLLAALAMLTKAVAVTLPLLVLAHAAIDRARSSRALPWRLVAALAAVSVAGLVYRWALLPPWVVASAHQPGVTGWRYFVTEWSAYIYYLRLFLWPDALTVDRVDFPYAPSILAPQAWSSLLALVLLGVLAWRARTRRPMLTFAALWFVLALAPESTFFPLAEPVNEHRPYLAMLGLGAVAGTGSVGVARRLASLLRVTPARAVAAVLSLVATGLGTATFARNATWRDDLRLWQDAIAKTPRNPRAWLNAGHAAMVAGRLDEARTLLVTAHELGPCYAYVQLNLSALAARTGDSAASLAWADEAVACNPTLALAHDYRAVALERLGRVDDALAAYARTTALDAQHAGAWFARGRLLETRAAWADAAAAFDRALHADPTLAEAAMRSALLHHYRLGDPAGAVERYRAALRILPTHYGAHYQLAVALLALGRVEDARVAWRAFAPLARAAGDTTALTAAPAALRGDVVSGT